MPPTLAAQHLVADGPIEFVTHAAVHQEGSVEPGKVQCQGAARLPPDFVGTKDGINMDNVSWPRKWKQIFSDICNYLNAVYNFTTRKFECYLIQIPLRRYISIRDLIT